MSDIGPLRLLASRLEEADALQQPQDLGRLPGSTLRRPAAALIERLRERSSAGDALLLQGGNQWEQLDVARLRQPSQPPGPAIAARAGPLPLATCLTYGHR